MGLAERGQYPQLAIQVSLSQSRHLSSNIATHSAHSELILSTTASIADLIDLDASLPQYPSVQYHGKFLRGCVPRQQPVFTIVGPHFSTHLDYVPGARKHVANHARYPGEKHGAPYVFSRLFCLDSA